MATEIKRHLNPIDFMMMDVHRELDETNFHPETIVDKSARPQQEEHSDEESVGVSYPHEQPLPPNVVQLIVDTTADISIENLLRGAYKSNLTCLVCVGQREDGTLYLASSTADMSEAMFFLQRGLHKFNTIMDETQGLGHEDDGKTPA